jgi:hypothetical protein
MPGTLTSPYTDNAATPAQNTVVGFKISKPGYDATRTAGNNYVFNSSWPSLPIAFEKIITGTGSPMTVAHNLKFPPFSMVWSPITAPSGGRTVGIRSIPIVDTTNVYLTSTVSGQKYIIRCFQLDLSRDIDYNLAPGDTFNMPYDNNFGIKAVKPFKDINSKDLRDFALHSRAQSPLILAVKTEKTIPGANVGTGIGNVVQYTSKLSYPVWVYGFIKLGSTSAAALGVAAGAYRPAPYYSQNYPRTFTDGFKSYIGYISTGSSPDVGATLVILRDPMFSSTPVTVQY